MSKPRITVIQWYGAFFVIHKIKEEIVEPELCKAFSDILNSAVYVIESRFDTWNVLNIELCCM